MAIFNYNCTFICGEGYLGFPYRLQIETLEKKVDLNKYDRDLHSNIRDYKLDLEDLKQGFLTQEEFDNVWFDYKIYIRNFKQARELVIKIHETFESNGYLYCKDICGFVKSLQHQFCFIWRRTSILDLRAIYLYVYIDYYCYLLGIDKNKEFEDTIDEALGLVEPTNLGYNIAKLGVSALKFGATLDPMKLSDVSESALNIYDTGKQVINSFRERKR